MAKQFFEKDRRETRGCGRVRKQPPDQIIDRAAKHEQYFVDAIAAKNVRQRGTLVLRLSDAAEKLHLALDDLLDRSAAGADDFPRIKYLRFLGK